jgi:DNA-directed RNA polymerase subunit RPC12/RpoP
MFGKIINIIRDNFSFKKLFLYMIRWQLSTPILAWITYLFTGKLESFASAFVANIVGALIFYWIDLITFLFNSLSHQWEVKENIICYDCNKETKRGYRLVIAPRYNRVNHQPQFRCEYCSSKKVQQLRDSGLNI